MSRLYIVTLLIYLLCRVSSMQRLPWWLSGKELKNPPANAETRVRSLGHEDPLEKEMATDSSILTWKIPWTEEPGRFTVHGVAKSRTGLSNL